MKIWGLNQLNKCCFRLVFRPNSCDISVKEELADRLLSPESDRHKDMFLRMLNESDYDLILTFSAGSSESVAYPHTTNKPSIFTAFATAIDDKRTAAGPSKPACAANAARMHHSDALQRVTNLFFHLYKVPMFTIDLNCCKMPDDATIGTVWRNNIRKLLNFLRLTETGVQGSVQTIDGHPLREASVHVPERNLSFAVTKNLAHFRIILPAGENLTIVLRQPGFMSISRSVYLVAGKITNLGVIQLRNGTDTVVTEMSLSASSGNNVADSNSDGGEISGYVLDDGNHPLANSRIFIVSPSSSVVQLSNISNDQGEFHLIGAPHGAVKLQAIAAGHITGERVINVGVAGTIRGVMFKLDVDEHVFGMPRFLFIVTFGCMGVLLVACCALSITCYQSRKRDRNYYSFSLLPQSNGEKKKLFDDDEDETDLFTARIKSEYYQLRLSQNRETFVVKLVELICSHPGII